MKAKTLLYEGFSGLIFIFIFGSGPRRGRQYVSNRR